MKWLENRSLFFQTFQIGHQIWNYWDIILKQLRQIIADNNIQIIAIFLLFFSLNFHLLLIMNGNLLYQDANARKMVKSPTSTHREIFSKYYSIKPKSNCIYPRKDFSVWTPNQTQLELAIFIRFKGTKITSVRRNLTYNVYWFLPLQRSISLEGTKINVYFR